MNERKYCVYMHKNKINDKVYIGITCTKPKKRWANGNGYKGNKKFYNDILKYGWDNFEHIILENNLDCKQAKEKEMYYIYINSFKDMCYNKTIGGEQGKIKYLTQEELNNSTRLYNKKYYQKNKDEIIKNVIKKQKSNRTQYNKYKKDYYYKNEEYHQRKIEYQREYRKKHKSSLEIRTII